jgi:hypothetical protein
MDDNTPSDGAAPRWTAPPTLKERTAVQRSVDRLLDGGLGSVGAVSVSWFPDADNDVALGELQVVAWRGTLSRPGSADRSEGAVVVKELVLRPIEGVPGEKGAQTWIWRAQDGTTLDGDALAAHCVALLELQMG